MPSHCFQEPKLQVLLKHQDTARKSLRAVLVSAFLNYQKTKMERKSECLSWSRSTEAFIILAFSMISGPTAGHWARADAYRLHTASSNIQQMRSSGYPQQSVHPRALIVISRKLQTPSDGLQAHLSLHHRPSWEPPAFCSQPTAQHCLPQQAWRAGASRASQHAQCQVWAWCLLPPRCDKCLFKHRLTIPSMELLGPCLILMEKGNFSSVKKEERLDVAYQHWWYMPFTWHTVTGTKRYRQDISQGVLLLKPAVFSL